MLTVVPPPSAAGRWPGTNATPGGASSDTRRTSRTTPTSLCSSTVWPSSSPRFFASSGWSTQAGAPCFFLSAAMPENAVWLWKYPGAVRSLKGKRRSSDSPWASGAQSGRAGSPWAASVSE